MFGKRVRYGITYRTNKRSFVLYRRKYIIHNLKINVNNNDYEGSFGICLNKLSVFLIAKVDRIYIFDSNTYQKQDEIGIQLLKTTSREPNEVIGMTKSKCERWVAIISGKNLVMNKQA